MLLNRSKPSREQVATVKSWARELLPIAPDATLMVTELECREEGCPSVETVIAALVEGQSPQQWKLHKSIATITRQDICQLCSLESQLGIRGWRCPD
jgi:hypothetical protein